MMNAAQEQRARELLKTAELAREIRDERRDREEEIVQLTAELAQERQKVADLQANLERYQAKGRILREAGSQMDALWYRLREAINND
jgi:hypothetical protein